MQLRNKYFTYPVIIADGDFYVDSYFDSDVDQIIDGYNIKLVLTANLINKELEYLLNEGKVVIAHHIECPQTCFRESVITSEKSAEFILKDGQVNGIVQVCTFLVANHDIDKYTNELFSSDYKGFKFDIEKGCILAVGNQFNLRVNKIRDDLVNTASIFVIMPNTDQSVTELKVNLMSNKIAIILPWETFALYSNTVDYLDVQPVMHSMIVIPALMYVFNELKEAREHLYNYEDYRWFRGIQKACSKMDIIIDYEGLESLDALSVAQKLLDSPIVKAINYLGSGGDFDED